MIGQIYESRTYGKYVVVDTLPGDKSKIRFVSTGYECVVCTSEVYRGRVKDYMKPHVAGVGYLGEGRYCATESIDGKKKNTPAYEVWNGIIKRCYNDKWRDTQRRQDYEGVEVAPEWHNFQNFAEWYYSQENWDKGFDVDKDLLEFGSRLYSPETCSLVPPAVNSLFTGSNERLSLRELPKGVHFCKTKQVYVAQLNRGEFTKSGNKKQSYLGQFKDKVPAILAYKKAKEEHVREVAEKYKDVLHPQVYSNLIAYEVDVTQWIKN